MGILGRNKTDIQCSANMTEEHTEILDEQLLFSIQHKCFICFLLMFFQVNGVFVFSSLGV